MYTSTTFDLTPTTQHQTFQNAEASIRYQFTPALRAALGETYTEVTANSKPASRHYWQTTSALQYFLSKRTDVYIDLIYQRSSGAVAAIEGTSGASSSHNAVPGCHRHSAEILKILLACVTVLRSDAFVQYARTACLRHERQLHIARRIQHRYSDLPDFQLALRDVGAQQNSGLRSAGCAR